jgi:peptide subunit release factor 1 (eRF1)
LESTVRSLAGFVGHRAPVTSFYLDVDGRRHPRRADVERRATWLLRRSGRLDGYAGHPSVQEDLRRIEERVRAGFDRRTTRGVAVFSCTAHDLFEVVELPAPVRDRVVVNHTPAVGQLERVIQEHAPIGVLLADRQRARMFVFELGELTERSELLDELPRDYDTPGERDRGTRASHVEALVHVHLRHAADVAWRVFQERPYAHLAIGAPEAVASELVALLHPYLRERLVGRVPLTTGSTLAEVRDVATEVEREADRRREAALVARLREEAAAGRRGVVGLRDTLAALNERRVERLLVSDGYAEEGWRCPTTGALVAVGPTSPLTGEQMVRVADVVEDAIELALNQGCAVHVCVDADLDCLGRIGALLRF